MENEPDWARVLRALYHRGIHLHEWKEPTGFGAIKKDDVGSEEYERYIDWHRELAEKQYQYIAEQTEFEESTINDAVQWLANHDLLNKKDPLTDEEFVYDGYCPVELTQTGFELAREQGMLHRQEIREDQRAARQNDVNRAIGFLTLGLLFVSVVDTLIQGSIELGLSQTVILGQLILDGSLAAVVAFFLIKTNLLTPSGQ